MSIKEDEAKDFWISTRGGIEFDYFEMGFDKAIELVGSCFECDYKYTDNCPLRDAISEVDLHTYYCASFDSKDIWK